MDFSFGCVIRILAGLDHVVQAAGRCNRHGEKGALCPVYLVNLQGENLSRLPEIQDGQRACEDLLERFAAAPEEYDSDLVSGKAIQKYYEILYGQLGPKTADYPLPDGKTTLFQLLSQNTAYQNKSSGAVPMRWDRHSKQPDKFFPCFLTTPRMCWFHFKRERKL